jgi:hypothetical protein
MLWCKCNYIPTRLFQTTVVWSSINHFSETLLCKRVQIQLVSPETRSTLPPVWRSNNQIWSFSKKYLNFQHYVIQILLNMHAAKWCCFPSSNQLWLFLVSSHNTFHSIMKFINFSFIFFYYMDKTGTCHSLN